MARRKCKRVVVCGKARRMCWGTNGKLSSNTAWKSKKRSGTKRKAAKRKTTAKRKGGKKKRTTRAKRVGMDCWKQNIKGQGCRMLCQVDGKFVSNVKARGCKGRKKTKTRSTRAA